MAAVTFPDVPRTQGVPPVRRGPSNNGTDQQPRLTADSTSSDPLSSFRWGVYSQGGGLVLEPDSIIAFGFGVEYRQADYPIERGGFETYDKVATPFETRVVMTKGGKLSERRAFINQLEQLRGDLILYNIVTPEAIYLNVNIGRINYDRSALNGAGMLTIEVVFREIRQTATIAFTNSKTPAGADDANDGSVQTKPTDQSGADIK